MVSPRRFSNGVELRAAAGAGVASAAGRKLVGHAVVWGAVAQLGPFAESFRAGAFRDTLAKRADVLALVDHSPERLLARVKSGTLRLREDAHGLAYEIDLPDTTLGRDLLALAERGDLGGVSIGFRATAEEWPAPTRREVRAAELVECSIVHAFPAYEASTVSARSHGALDADAWRRRLIVEAL